MNINKNIPFSIKRLFWDVNKEKLNTNLHKKNIIERILNYGVLADWKWLSSVYNKKEILETINSKDKFNRKNIRQGASHLASILFK
ncbi:hypothetical protein COX93_02775 [Candidatus Nomurabacteria bacterium CG_4_10_14_0_2_um_filter_30_12]|uniref:DUF6922 domain-containing protein n=3 Tax=Candidatus Nomuraibacteriota TaxID=1752729 RepID=A0A1J4V4F0_9BACT|nr:MAG: hypothetical protein AUJ22_01895 [Candidatus Nomurabacteria bacterium CG1_02_31_12]PIR68861.1 MAG: hypothetical protein COU48_01750 [Candidatus Nomurabacteria bacterium CG10_big_fil_rev_8_21_14_0_10_03_31_7]PIZ86919.1 MAG: hypothetical protein COX93_02775 [Candidatus Nomurabacteria bacterium CG_4_10_14_0_2_um_filter_30_12]